MEQHIVYQGKSKSGKDFVIRYLTKNDTQAMCDFINTLSQEQTYISFQGEQMTLEEETKFVNDALEKIQKQHAVLLLVFSEGKLIGNSGIFLKEKIEKHVGVFAISIAKGYRGEGIGKLLMENVLEEAVKNIPTLRIVILGLFATNTKALQLYKHFGFGQYGFLPQGVLHKGQLIDHIYMYKTVRT